VLLQGLGCALPCCMCSCGQEITQQVPEHLGLVRYPDDFDMNGRAAACGPLDLVRLRLRPWMCGFLSPAVAHSRIGFNLLAGLVVIAILPSMLSVAVISASEAFAALSSLTVMLLIASQTRAVSPGRRTIGICGTGLII